MTATRQLALVALFVCAPALPRTASCADMVVLVVDAEHLENSLSLYAMIDQEAAALALSNPAARNSLRLAADLRRSEILTALPEIIAGLAKAANADLVLDKKVALRLGEKAAKDLTSAVEQQLESRYAGLPLEPAT